MAPPLQPALPRFEPCASTASLFLYAQGSTILCLHHDTLAIERRFQSHQENIDFISVDNVSERGAGRLVVSYDVGQTAIVWDIFTGTEIARFASFEHLRVASWMRNGNVAFGNGKGEVILFEPPTQEHISARTIFDPITAMAPATDCRTHAIGETWSWDVRTKHVTYDPIPTIDGVRGLANYGPTATLFTLGPQNSVQQYDLENPAMVANVQHLPVGSRSGTSENNRSRTMSPRRLQDPPDIREPTNAVRRTPFDASGIESIRQRADLTSPASSRSRTESVSSKASSSKYNTRPFSPPSRSGQSATTFSLTSAGGDTPQPSASAASFAYPSSVSMSSVRSSRAASRLRNEVHLSPAEKNIVDLFPFTRARLNDVPYKQQPPLDDPDLTSDDLRQQMLSVVFGWDGDIEDLIRDELSRHAVGSQSAILLAQWLGETDTEQMASMVAPGPVTTSDWMLLALSQMSGQAQGNKVGQAFVQKLLEVGDTHTSAAILLGLGDSNDAIEVYVSRNHFMEAILMTCLLMPSDWQRQSYLVRRWGEHVVTHSQQQLAIRCFMCTGVEPSEPWASPSAQQAASFAEMIRAKSPLASPEPSQANISSMMPPPIRPRSASNQKPAAKTPALKLITSFDAQPNQRFRFPGLKSDDRTPTNAPGITPIAESAVPDSALSPGGLGSWKLNNIQSLNHAMTSRTNTPSFNRRRLPSIGETPVDVHPPTFSRSNSNSQNEYGSTSENETSGHEHSQDERESDSGLLTLPSARYDPKNDSLKPSPQTAVQGTDKFATIKGLPSPAAGVFDALTNDDHRNGSRDRKPDGLQIELLDSERNHQDRSDLVPSARSTASTTNSFTSAKSPSVSGRSIDQYISSLDEANFHARKYRGPHTPGRGRRNTDDAASQSSRIHQSRDASRDTRGRNDRRYIQPAKRSPSSPVPMSPEELARYGAGESEKPVTKPKSKSRTRSSSKMRRPDSRARQRSSSRHTASRIADKRDALNRGRSNDRQGSSTRSPSSPLPMSFPRDEPSQTDGADDPLRIVASNQQRLRSRHRSASRRRAERGTSAASARRDGSPESRHKTSQSLSEIQQGPKADPWVQASEPVQLLSSKVFGQEPPFSEFPNGQPSSTVNDFQDIVSPTTPFVSVAERKRREFAAAELEARRLSLARNPSAPNIPFPGELQSIRSPIESPPPFSAGNSYFPRAPSRNKVTQSKPSPDYPSSSDSNSSRSGMPVGLPATPRAMRHPKYGGNGQDEERPPSVPTIPSDTNLFLSNARYQGDAERIGRSMSVPVPESQFSGTAPMPTDLPMHPRFNPALPRSRSSSRSRNTGHRRTSSGGFISGTSPNLTVSIEETIEHAMQRGPSVNYDSIPPPPPPPPILPELQHLNTPPPPPPFPISADPISPRESSATIDIAIDNNEDLGRLLPRAMTAAPAFNVHTQSVGPQSGNRRMSFDHRRNRSSNESFTNKLRSLTRMRSTASRSVEPWSQAAESDMPYESMHSHGVASNQNYVLPSQSYVSPGQNFV
ncbi:hypothetical protein PENARI_c001G02465 [Penicillium arizonense]|uniref:Gem-associated protein 5 TPR domain-containing protein n=1 Tax=Penicillium arizonense TaxID=1835702 RepID=A0A1F5LWY0_PENAI|nr:hypothetical protein PENARI_c001G02465 [Penicillium arizonense]OGE57663.1 hypothetical protein PENARI_c001G02465 [Penicillium arizonense]